VDPGLSESDSDSVSVSVSAAWIDLYRPPFAVPENSEARVAEGRRSANSVKLALVDTEAWILEVSTERPMPCSSGPRALFSNGIWRKEWIAMESRVRRLSVNGVAALVLGWLTVGCSITPQHEINEKYRSVLAQRREQYKIKPGDKLTVRVFQDSGDLSPQSVIVRPDGRGDLFLLHDFRFAGKTVQEVVEELKEPYSGELANPEIIIDLEPKSEKIYLTGEFERPAAVDYQEGMTLQDALALGGGAKITSDSDYAVLRRRIGASPGESQWFRIDVYEFERYDESPEFRQEVVLLPGDHIWIEKNAFATVIAYLREYVFGIVPTSLWGAASFGV
jgi:protein involved in polysaccharide export with SLBB domain